MPRLYFLTSATCTWAVVRGMRTANLPRSHSGYAEQEQRDRGDVEGVAEDSCCGEQGILPLLSGGRIREPVPVPVPGHQRPSSEPRVRHLRRSFDVGPRGKSAGGAPDSVSAGPRDAEKTTPPPPPTAASPSTLTSSSTVPPPPTAASTSPPASKNKTENAEFGVSNCDSCGLAGCCGGASGTSSTTTTTLGATPGAHTTTVAATTSSTTPSPLDLDLCFVFDTTGSMGAYLEQLKQKITGLANDIVSKVRKHMPDLPPEKMPRYAVVPYKDFSDPSHLSRSTILDFTGDTNKLSASIQPIAATGGGSDTAEDILGAVHTATETLAWESKIRFLVVVTDAPGHGPELYDGPSDTQTPSGRWSDDPPPTVDVAMKRLQSQSINLIFVTCNAAATRKTEHAMRDHYNNEEREMTSLPLKSAEGFIEKIRELVVNKLIGRDHVAGAMIEHLKAHDEDDYIFIYKLKAPKKPWQDKQEVRNEYRPEQHLYRNGKHAAGSDTVLWNIVTPASALHNKRGGGTQLRCRKCKRVKRDFVPVRPGEEISKSKISTVRLMRRHEKKCRKKKKRDDNSSDSD